MVRRSRDLWTRLSHVPDAARGATAACDANAPDRRKLQDGLQRARSVGLALLGATAYVLFGAGSVTIALFALGIVPMGNGHEFWRLGALVIWRAQS